MDTLKDDFLNGFLQGNFLCAILFRVASVISVKISLSTHFLSSYSCLKIFILLFSFLWGPPPAALRSHCHCVCSCYLPKLGENFNLLERGQCGPNMLELSLGVDSRTIPAACLLIFKRKHIISRVEADLLRKIKQISDSSYKTHKSCQSKFDVADRSSIRGCICENKCGKWLVCGFSWGWQWLSPDWETNWNPFSTRFWLKHSRARFQWAGINLQSLITSSP